VLAVVDEESELTYLDTTHRTVEGTSSADVPAVTGTLLAERVLCWNPPEALYEQAFYGQELDDDAVQLSLVEAAYLARKGLLDVDGGETAVVERGRDVEGDRFDRRLTVYAALRDADVVPKTGFKFGADFRTYADVESVENLGHSELLVRALPATHAFEPRDLALDVRLAHGVRKTMVFALVGDGLEWVQVERLTP
jgi:tRNA-intron endonuclease